MKQIIYTPADATDLRQPNAWAWRAAERALSGRLTQAVRTVTVDRRDIDWKIWMRAGDLYPEGDAAISGLGLQAVSQAQMVATIAAYVQLRNKPDDHQVHWALAGGAAELLDATVVAGDWVLGRGDTACVIDLSGDPHWALMVWAQLMKTKEEVSTKQFRAVFLTQGGDQQLHSNVTRLGLGATRNDGALHAAVGRIGQYLDRQVPELVIIRAGAPGLQTMHWGLRTTAQGQAQAVADVVAEATRRGARVLVLGGLSSTRARSVEDSVSIAWAQALLLVDAL